MSELNPDTVYEDVWKDVVEVDGELQMDRVKALLFDYGSMLQNNSVLYPYITDGRITHPQHDIEEVIAITEEETFSTVNAVIQSVLDALYADLETTKDQNGEVRLMSLIDTIDEIYTRGGDDLD